MIVISVLCRRKMELRLIRGVGLLAVRSRDARRNVTVIETELSTTLPDLSRAIISK